LEDAQQFKRWDVVQYSWQSPRDDRRTESRRVEHHSLVVGRSLPTNQRFGLIAPMVKESLTDEVREGRSLAFIRPVIRRFIVAKKPQADIDEERDKFQAAAKQTDLFLGPIVPYEPCPYQFKYDYETKDGKRTGTCQPPIVAVTPIRQDVGEPFGIDAVGRVCALRKNRQSRPAHACGNPL
jgi:hypothetical protein